MASEVHFTLDPNELVDAMNLYQKATGKDAKEIVKRATVNTVIGNRKYKGAFYYTPKGKVAFIRKYSPLRKRAREYENSLFNALATQGTKFGRAKKGEGNAQLARRIYNSRIAAFGYSKGLWVGIAKAFGRAIHAKVVVDPDKAEFYDGINPTAIFQTPDIPLSFVSRSVAQQYQNTMQSALRRGMANAARDMREYAQKKLQQRADQFEPF